MRAIRTIYVLPASAIVGLALLIGPPSRAQAQECVRLACIDVYTENGQIIIVGKKETGPITAKSQSVIKPKVIAPKVVAPKVVAPRVIAPKPVAPRVIAPTRVPLKAIAPTRVSSKPLVRKPASKDAPRKVIQTSAAISLSDRLVKLLPTGGIAYQPNFEPLAKVPIYFWCDLPPIFQARVTVVGEAVDVLLRPSFSWSYGDGNFFQTTHLGAPYPYGEIVHTYSNAGTYIVTLLTTWNGTFSHNAQVRAITGQIKTVSIVTIKVVAAPSRLVK